MTGTPPEIFTLPPLLYIIGAMSAMSFIIATSFWLWQAGCVQQMRALPSFKSTIWRLQIHSVLIVVFFSFAVSLYDNWGIETAPYPTAEIIIIGFAMLGGAIYGRSRGVGAYIGVLRMLKITILLALACVIGWGISIAFGASLSGGIYYFFYSGDIKSSYDLGFMPVLITGMLWNAPILWMYLRASNRGSAALSGQKFHHFLWPLLLAYMVLCAPLIIQNAGNSEKWQEMKYAKQVKQA